MPASGLDGEEVIDGHVAGGFIFLVVHEGRRKDGLKLEGSWVLALHLSRWRSRREDGNVELARANKKVEGAFPVAERAIIVALSDRQESPGTCNRASRVFAWYGQAGQIRAD
jgi:hypothetical protein